MYRDDLDYDTTDEYFNPKPSEDHNDHVYDDNIFHSPDKRSLKTVSFKNNFETESK